ncbi:MAG TPA: glycosyltransferase [Acidimicrobiales bacterium]|nr:glycosyltransferase [Acidimicrobiales bacterium]
MASAPILVIAWINRNGRTEDLGYWLGAEVRFMPWAWPGLPLPRRMLSWLRSGFSTAAAVRRLRHGTVIVVEPPVFAPLVAWAARRSGCRLFLDLHSGALIAPNWRWARPLLRFVARRCDGIITTNRETLHGFDIGGTPSYVLHDPLWARPRPAGSAPGADPSRPYVLFPASANPDEPFALVEQVGAVLEGDPLIRVTGRVNRSGCTGVEYVGFLPQEEYLQMLSGAAAVLALTEWEATMQRSAYEAVGAGVPVVALDRRVLRQLFDGGGALFAAPEPHDIARAVREALEHRDRLSEETSRSRQRMKAESEIVKEALLGRAT